MKKRILVIISIVIAVIVVIGISFIIGTSSKRLRRVMRNDYEEKKNMIEDPTTRELLNAPIGQSPEEAFDLYFKKGSAWDAFEYDGHMCVVGDTAVGIMIAEIRRDSDNQWAVEKVFDRVSERNPLNMEGEHLNTTCLSLCFSLPGSENPKEVVVASQGYDDTKPQDTNKAVFYEIQNTGSNVVPHWKHWYAFSDVDQDGYCIIWSGCQD